MIFLHKYYFLLSFLFKHVLEKIQSLFMYVLNQVQNILLNSGGLSEANDDQSLSFEIKENRVKLWLAPAKAEPVSCLFMPFTKLWQLLANFGNMLAKSTWHYYQHLLIKNQSEYEEQLSKFGGRALVIVVNSLPNITTSQE